MGFGLLFIGYFISMLMSINPYGWIFQIVGFYIIFRALGKLYEYKHSFSRCLVPLMIMAICQVFLGICSLDFLQEVTDLFSNIQALGIDTLISTIYVTLLMIFHFLLLSSVRDLALDVEDTATARLASRNFYIVGAYFVLDILTTFLPLGNIKSVLSLVTILASIVYPIFILYLLFRCYASICAPEDKDMEPKPSRFAFINKRREMRKTADDKIEKLIEQQDKNKEKTKK